MDTTMAGGSGSESGSGWSSKSGNEDLDAILFGGVDNPSTDGSILPQLFDTFPAGLADDYSSGDGERFLATLTSDRPSDSSHGYYTSIPPVQAEGDGSSEIQGHFAEEQERPSVDVEEENSADEQDPAVETEEKDPAEKQERLSVEEEEENSTARQDPVVEVEEGDLTEKQGPSVEENDQDLVWKQEGPSVNTTVTPPPVADSESSLGFKPMDFEIALHPLPARKREEYVTVYSDEVDFLVEEVPGNSSDQALFRLEFTDGTQETIPLDELLQYPGGKSAYSRFYTDRSYDMAANRNRKRRHADFESSGSESVDDLLAGLDARDDELPSKPKRLRLTSRHTSENAQFSSDDDEAPASRPRARQLRERHPRKLAQVGLAKPINYADDEDELAQDTLMQMSDGDGDGTFQLVTSDINPKPHRNRLRLRSLKHRGTKAAPSSRGSSIEFEDDSRRRSGRSTRNQKTMLDEALMDDESFYVEDSRSPAVPKIISVKEVFKALPPDSDFPSFHEDACRICNLGPVSQKGQLIGCQGCSFSFHKVCIGYRAQREHQATKVGTEDFVLQCKWCIGGYRKKDGAAPQYGACQQCKQEGLSCAAFSEKLTSRQEEKLRQENGGEDPITPVDPDLVNNPSNTLFRCVGCKRSWHFEHLPSSRMQSDISDLREQRLTEYSVDWKCEDCGSKADKAQTLVAWRPANKTEATTYDDMGVDEREYLVKWQDKSYHHCSWMPGAWIFGVTPAAMQKSFAKRDVSGSLMRLTTKEAIPEEYLLIDVILQVKGEETSRTSKEADMNHISRIKQIYVKFQGLGYDEVVWDSPPSPESGSQFDAFQAAYQEYLNGKYFANEPNAKLKERLRKYKNDDFADPTGQPVGIKRGKLMEYQLEGVAWMLYNFHQDRNIILADEMGLGKTVQVISLIAQLALDGPRVWPFMVVVPNSTCPNWRREIKFWAPDLRVVTYHGGKRSQELAYKYELFPNGSRDMKAHIVVMSYDSAQDERTRSLFKTVQWAGLVVDEGQRLKNDQNLLYGALQAMRFPFRLLLTGTPLQNNKRELFNLLHFVDPSHNAAELDEEYSELNAENLPKLHEKIRPYFLRRTKAAVLKFLPPMAQIILPVSMTVLQAKLCKSIMAKSPELLKAIFADDKVRAKDRGNLNNILVQLRKCLCHPFMYSEAIEEKGLDAAQSHANLISASAKLILLQQMLPKLKARGHRILLFSQFLNQLDIAEDFLNGLGLEYRRLDGSISSLEKQRRIDAFNAPDSPVFAFLLSTRAGGVGINLATADTVIILDPDFNPHQDIQALSRAHRIGQKNKVLCFQLVTKNSAEEKIMQIGRKKMALDHVLIESMDNEDEAPDDLESILKYGASALFGEGESEKDIIRYDDASIDKLLDRSEIEQTKTDDDGATNFAFARVWANEKGSFDADLAEHEDPTLHPSVWDNILREREAEALRLAEKNKVVLGRGGRRRQAINYRTNQAVDAADDSGSDVDEDFKDSGNERDEDDEVEAAVDATEINALDPKTRRKSKLLEEAGESGRSTPVSKTPKSKAQEKGAAKTKQSNDKQGQKHAKQANHNLPQGAAAPSHPSQLPLTNAVIGHHMNGYQFSMPTAIPPHLRGLYEAFGRGEVQRDQFLILADRLTQQAVYGRGKHSDPNPGGAISNGGPLAVSNATVANGRPPDRGVGQHPRQAIEVAIPSPSSANIQSRPSPAQKSAVSTPKGTGSVRSGKCPMCGENHRPSMCPKLVKERHVRLALDGLAQWSSDPQEKATERIALKKRLHDFR